MSQYRYQQQYRDGMRRQALIVQVTRSDDYYAQDPYFHTAPSYSYSWGGQFRQINSYGVVMLRNAVNYGYQQGFASGQADHEDGWRSDVRNSYGYQDALYGFDGLYIAPDEYAYYFRQGFQRGYEDGFYTRAQYGVRVSGSLTIIGSILDQILELRPLR